jgi:hypothetical protein
MRTVFISVGFLILLIVPLRVNGQKPEFSGQLSTQILAKPGMYWHFLTSVRYIPEIRWNKPLGDTWKFGLEASANLYGQAGVQKHDTLYTDALLKPYRVWGRISSERFEARLGLQKISFGSATMLRPLMWFDRMDPRDPLQMTDGVYALLGRYFFQNNANLWIWGVWPGKSVKGWEYFNSDPGIPEMGGRLQVPAGKGELALSTHLRWLGTDQTGSVFPVTLDNRAPEFRLGLDGKWDVGPGIWFEGTYTWQQLPMPEMKQIRMLTVGTDYTIPVGNGMTLVAEQFIYQTGPSFSKTAMETDFTAISLAYPITMTHTLSAMVFYNWMSSDWYRFISWKISLRKVSFYLMAFWNPDKFDLYQNTGNTNLMGGKGLQLLFIWNH